VRSYASGVLPPVVTWKPAGAGPFVVGLLWASLWVVACGSRASVGFGEPIDDEGLREASAGQGSGADAPDQGGGGGAPRGGGLDFQRSVLPECILGFPPREADGRRCDYSYEGLCYEDADSACACACPTRGSSACVHSGLFTPPDQPLVVSCR
jgi:hypothetical protein